MTPLPSEQWVNSIIQGDTKVILRQLPNASMDCIVTSPPYYLQRDYNTDTQIGNEELPEEYIQNLRLIFWNVIAC